ncbi:CehA/McbA family metallohydrolase [Adhaeribacter pallidiroseus]|uniref:CehA/McbA family metallohydrolase n=1 Tax=Adhaeribacter pallidiroseus TaxID=2072847 RepID=UPI001F275B35|nr:CehA/McbA family metallohydrolase [Adhaeribacter pallidiroseus]
MLLPINLSAQQPTTGYLEVQVIDATTNQLMPVRVRLSRNGWAVKNLPKEATAVMYGVWDHADGYDYQPDSSFYVAGKFSLDLPPGTYHLTLAKGPEFVEQQHDIQIIAGQVQQQTYQLKRWINMPEKGWYSADDHIHIRRSPREDSLLLTWTQAEDVHVGVMLRMGDFWETYYPQYAWGEKGVYQKKDYLLTSGQEDPRTPELGHALGIGASDKVRFGKEYYYYDKVFDKLRELGGLGGYAHQAETFHGYRGLTLDGLRGKIDVLELLQFCASDKPLITNHYYHLLDLGIPITAVAGSDFPWCGQDHDKGPPERSARLGNVRFYTYVDGPLTYNSWKAGLAAGHTFVSNGPMLQFTVNDQLPGSKLEASKGTTLHITAHAYGHTAQVPLQSLEIVGHGRVLGRVTPSDAGQSPDHLSLTLDIPAEQGIWLAARAYGNPTQAAHTTPVYVQVDGKNFHNPVTAPQYLKLSEQYLKELKKNLKTRQTDPQYRGWQYRAGLERRIAETQQVIKGMKKQLK